MSITYHATEVSPEEYTAALAEAAALTAIPQRIATSKVDDLQFREIVDELQYNWVVWGVSFTFQGKECWGVLEACPFNPEVSQSDTIEDCDEE
jgi:hypothetical protein